jgi:hypothetical protein
MWYFGKGNHVLMCTTCERVMQIITQMPVFQMSIVVRFLSPKRVQFEMLMNKNKTLWNIIVLLLFKII